MQLIQRERVVRANRSTSIFYFIRELYDIEGRLITYEYIDKSPVSPKAPHYKRYKELLPFA